jgi:subtilase family serine protease
MSLPLRSIAIFCLSSIALASCGAGHSALPAANTVHSNPVTPYTGAPQLAAFTWGKDIVSQAQYIGPANVGTLSVDVQLKMQNQPGLLQYAAMVSDPHSGLYRHFLTPQEIGARFGASQSDYNTIVAYFAKYRLGVASWPQRLSMVVSGKQSDLEAAFGTKFGVYRAYRQTFVAPTIQPHFSQVLPVSSVSRLVHLNLNRTFLIRGGNGNFFGMSGPQLRRAFDFTGAASTGLNGSGITVGIIGTGPILTGSSGDTTMIGRLFNEQVASVTLAPVVGQTPGPANNNTGTSVFDPFPSGLQTPPPLTPLCTPPGATQPGGNGIVSATCNPEDGEAQLDTEQIAQLAPGANVLFYLAYNAQDCNPAAPYNNPAGCPSGATGVEGIWLTDDEIQQAIADNSVDVLSLSYGYPEPLANSFGYFDTTGAGPGPLEFAALAAEGIAVFVSSGDNGAHGCIDQTTGAPTSAFCVYYPASDPSTVAVGGVNYPMDSAGNLPPSAQITAWATNTTLGGDGTGDNSPGSGGGLSQFFTATSAHQTALPASILGTSTGGKRVLPDVSMLADPLTGPMLLMYANGTGTSTTGPFAFPSGGTSAAAPEMAAAWAVVLQACKASACASATGTHPWRLGDPKALLYGIYGKSSTYASTFYDAVAGNNGDLSNYPSPGPNYYGGYGAGTGFDLVTGMGVPFVGHLINAVVTGENVP